MPPLAHPRGDKGSSSGAGGRQRQQETLAASSWQRSASFHGRGAEAEQRRLLPKQRPKTQPDLLAGMRPGASARASSSRSGSPDGEPTGMRTPSKVLVSVSVQRSMWPLHVMASAEWRVSDLVAAAVALYVKEGRRPPLPSADPAAFDLHYSQFSLESTFLWFLASPPTRSAFASRHALIGCKVLYGLDPSERVMELGSRSFFLCPKFSALGLAVSSPSSSNGSSGVISREASGKAGETPAWMSYMQFWPMT
ncbi:hypothetical protein EJB05_38141, partial [Eragrostis curvula]